MGTGSKKLIFSQLPKAAFSGKWRLGLVWVGVLLMMMIARDTLSLLAAATVAVPKGFNNIRSGKIIEKCNIFRCSFDCRKLSFFWKNEYADRNWFSNSPYLVITSAAATFDCTSHV